MAPGPPPLPIMPSNAGQPRATGMLAQGGTSTTSTPSDALTGFVKNYLTMKEATRQLHAQKFQEGVSMLAQGIPIGGPKDLEKLMKHGRNAGYDWLPTTAPTAEEAQAHAQVSGMQAPDESGTPPAPIGGPPQSQPGLLQRIGITQPPVSSASPMGQFLTNLSQAGQIGGGMVGNVARGGQTAEQKQMLQDLEVGFEKQFGFPLKGMSAEQEQRVLTLMKSAFAGDLGARQTLAGASKNWELPMDSYMFAMKQAHPELSDEQARQQGAKLYQYVAMGPMQHDQYMMNYSKDLAQFFQNNPFKARAFLENPNDPNNQPELSWEQAKSKSDVEKNFFSQFSTTHPWQANLYSLSTLLPGEKGDQYRDVLMKTLRGKDAKGQALYPTAGSIDLQKHYSTLGYDYARLSQEADISAKNLNLGIFSELGKQNKEASDDFWKIANDPNSTNDQHNAAIRALVGNMNKSDRLSINYRGQEFPLGPGDMEELTNMRPGWLLAGGKSYLSPKEAPEQVLNRYLGTASQTKAMKEFAQQAISMPDGRAKKQAMGSVINALQQVPKAARQALIRSLQLPDDMKKAAQEAANAEMPTEPISVNPGQYR